MFRTLFLYLLHTEIHFIYISTVLKFQSNFKNALFFKSSFTPSYRLQMFSLNECLNKILFFHFEACRFQLNVMIGSEIYRIIK